MATTLTGCAVKVSAAAVYATTLEFGEVAQTLRYNISNAFADGTGADQAQKLWTDQRTLTASATEELDLAGGLTDVFGTALTLTKVKALIIKAAAANTNNVIVGGAASNAWAAAVGAANDTITVRPGGTLVLIAPDSTGYAVTAGTGDLLKIANSAGSTSVTYDIAVLGI